MEIVKSKKFKQYQLQINKEPGVLELLVNGDSTIDIAGEKYFLRVEYVGEKYHVYDIEGIAFGMHNDNITTPELLNKLQKLGFKFESVVLRNKLKFDKAV